MVVKDRIQEVVQRVDSAKSRAGRLSDKVRIMAVTKTRSFAAVEAARDAGISLFGENRIQEAREKYPAGFSADAELHLIGHLQRNKARFVPGLFSTVESIDSERTARALSSALDAAGANPMDIYLEINTSGEESKQGYTDRETLFREVEKIARLDNVRISGLMTMAPFTDDESTLRKSFSALRETFHMLSERFDELPLTELSMGMSNDFEIAVEEGSTLLRLGTVLFGNRPEGGR